MYDMDFPTEKNVMEVTVENPKKIKYKYCFPYGSVRTYSSSKLEKVAAEQAQFNNGIFFCTYRGKVQQ